MLQATKHVVLYPGEPGNAKAEEDLVDDTAIHLPTVSPKQRPNIFSDPRYANSWWVTCDWPSDNHLPWLLCGDSSLNMKTAANNKAKWLGTFQSQYKQ